ncbi:class F sortase [Nesterenkonia halotolerans]
MSPDAAPDADAADSQQGVRPVAVNIPSIEVEESLIDLGIAEDGTMEVPEDWNEVGWFDGGGMPGGRGPTVLAGHLDSTTGPAVFHRLVELEPGDEVEVTDAEGEIHEYRVQRTEVFPKDDFPTQEVFGAQPQDELRLITCTGLFDVEEGSHEDNHIVFAVPVDTAPTK